MKKVTIVFFYFMKSNIDNMNEKINDHVKYWKFTDLADYEGGPFSDRSGGMIKFSVESYETGKEIIDKDPFILQNCIDKMWIKEWSLS